MSMAFSLERMKDVIAAAVTYFVSELPFKLCDPHVLHPATSFLIKDSWQQPG